LDAAHYLGTPPETPYRRFHEIFRGYKKRTTVEEILKHFLRIRNAVAAHANSTPPRDLMLSEDNVYEIQNLVTFLIDRAVRRVGRVPEVQVYEPAAVSLATDTTAEASASATTGQRFTK
ncbi:MAG: hypothetical protein ACRELE_03010, partial [Gemmatimonadales bacterium]